MSDIKDRMKFQSTADDVTKSVADTVAQVLSNSAPAKSRFEQQAELMNYPLQDKPEVADAVQTEGAKIEQLKKDVAKLFNKEDASNDKSDDGEGLDKADPKAAKKKFKDRKDKDIDNDGDVDDSDKFLHKKRKAISKAVKKEEGSEELRLDGRNKTFKEKLRALGYVKEKSLIYNNKKSGK